MSSFQGRYRFVEIKDFGGWWSVAVKVKLFVSKIKSGVQFTLVEADVGSARGFLPVFPVFGKCWVFKLINQGDLDLFWIYSGSAHLRNCLERTFVVKWFNTSNDWLIDWLIDWLCQFWGTLLEYFCFLLLYISSPLHLFYRFSLEAALHATKIYFPSV